MAPYRSVDLEVLSMIEIILAISLIILLSSLSAVAVRISTGEMDPIIFIYGACMGIIAMWGVGMIPGWCLMIPILICTFLIYKAGDFQ